MWISRTEEYDHIDKIRVDGMSKPAEFDDDGKARVTQDDGSVLIERGIATERETEKGSSQSIPPSDDTDTESDSEGESEGESDSVSESTDSDTETEDETQ